MEDLNKNNGKPWLQRWLEGALTASTEKELEANAQDDPFLKDAWEGLEQFPEGKHQDRIARIKGRLQERTRKNRVVGIPYWARLAAASVALLLLVGTFIWVNSDSTNALADIPAETQETEKIVEEPEDSRSSTAPETERFADEELLEQEASKTVDNPVVPSAPLSREVAPPPPPIVQSKPKLEQEEINHIAELDADMSAQEIEFEQVKESASGYVAEEITVEPKPIILDSLSTIASYPPPVDGSTNLKDAPVGFSKRSKTYQNNTPRTIKGIILDQETGEPLIGASIYEPNTVNGTTSDIDGNFTLNIIKDSISLEVAYTGYSTQQFQVSDEDYIEINLEIGTALEEVVIVNADEIISKSKRNKAARTDSKTLEQHAKRSESSALALTTLANPMPKDGFPDLEAYIQKKLKYPKAAKENNIEGAVQVEFFVKSNGKLKDFKIRKSLGYGCDEEAIRLLKKGPRWIASEQNRKGTYTIIFSLN